MKRVLSIALACLIPFALVAQAATAAAATPATDKRTELLKSFKLSDAQISQVKDIEQALTTKLKDGAVHLQLLDAQIRDAVLTNAKPDLTAINKLVDQKAQLQSDLEKARLAAEVQLIQIMGRDNFDKYYRGAGNRWGAMGPGMMRGAGKGQFGPGMMGRLGKKRG